MKIAILGGGHGAHAAAADLAQRGFEITMFSRTASDLDAVNSSGGITLVEGGKEEFVKPVKAAPRVKEAVEGAAVIMIIVPSTGHEYMAKTLGPHLQDNQIVILNPGHTGGALEFRKLLADEGAAKDVLLCETMTLTYLTRLAGPGRVQIFRRAKSVKYSSLPSSKNKLLKRHLSRIFPSLKPAKNVVDTGLMNVNALMHPAGTIMNAGRIEHTGGDFFFYSQGLTESICNVIEVVDKERLSIARSMGVSEDSFVKIFFGLGSSVVERGTILQSVKGSVPNRSIKAPNSLDTRYLHEDVGHGLVPMIEFAKIAGVETPLMSNIVDLACTISGINYWEKGRSAKKLGIQGFSKEELIRFVSAG